MTVEDIIKDRIYNILRQGGYTTSGDAVEVADEIYDAIWKYVKEE